MNSNDLSHAVSILILLPVALSAQATDRDVVFLKNWPAPLYWQPTQAETQATAAAPDAVRPTTGVGDATSSPSPLVFVGITPCRAVDTRADRGFTGPFGPPSLAASASRTFPIQSSSACSIPSVAQAYSINVTVVPKGPLGFMKIYPTGQAQPPSGTLNSPLGFVMSNAAIAPAGSAGSVDVYASHPTDVVIDINGYYAPAGGMTLAQGTASAPALSFSGAAGTGSATGMLTSAAVGTNGLSPNSTGDVELVGNFHATGRVSSGSAAVTIDGNRNSIVVDANAPLALFGNASEMYFGGDDGTSATPIPSTFSKIKLGIGTRTIPFGSKVRIFDPSLPALEVSSGTARGQFAVATAPSVYSLIAAPGDVVLRADADDPTSTATHDLILASRSATPAFGGAIRFTTGTIFSETEKMTILPSGSVGINTPFPSATVTTPTSGASTPLLDVAGQARVRILNGLPDNLVTAANGPTKGLLGSIAFPSPPDSTKVLLGDGTFGSLPGVKADCGSPLNYVTKWLTATTVGCSEIFDTGTPSTPGFVGIGTTKPSKELDVNGVINARKWYDIGLTETPVLSIGPTVKFTDGNVFVGAQAGNNTVIPNGQDTFVGYQSGFTATGTGNTFSGYKAGYGNTISIPNTGSSNTYSGSQAGVANTTGCCNVFSGFSAGSHNTSGGSNSFVGYYSGAFTQDGAGNTFMGYQTGVSNVSGGENSFFGDQAGNHTNTTSTTGYNSFFGSQAGVANTTGHDNTYIGARAGYYNTTGSSNVYIANQGPFFCCDSNTIRIGNLSVTYATQNKVFIEPILPNIASGDTVTINTTTGQLGHTGSSRRFKEQIRDMGDSSGRLFQLRPVTFFYKPEYDDGSHLPQYGLIAEEVAKVYPDMVGYDKDGQPSSVRYQLLAPMLLNELQKQHTVVTAQQDVIKTQQEQIQTQAQRIQDLEQRFLRLESALIENK